MKSFNTLNSLSSENYVYLSIKRVTISNASNPSKTGDLRFTPQLSSEITEKASIFLFTRELVLLENSAANSYIIVR